MATAVGRHDDDAVNLCICTTGDKGTMEKGQQLQINRWYRASKYARYILLIILCLWMAVAGKAELRAGVERVDITPPLGKYTLVASRKIATSIRDPLYAKVIVFESDTIRIAVVSLDLVGSFPPELFDEYRRRLMREAAIDYIVLNASHTHESLDLETNAGELRKWPWTANAMKKIYAAILEAHRNAVSDK